MAEGKFVFTQKGGLALMHAGYAYLKIRTGESGRIFWRCTKHRTCEARVTSIGHNVQSIRGTHNHPPEGAPLPCQPLTPALACLGPTRQPSGPRKSSEFDISVCLSTGECNCTLQDEGEQGRVTSRAEDENWVRNRRRPTAQKMAERIAEKLVQDRVSLPVNHSSTPPALVSASTSYVSAPHAVARLPEAIAHPVGGGLEPKRICLDSIAVPFSQLHSPGPGLPLLLKVRVAGSSDSDFVEVELCLLSYQALLRVCCEELEVQPSDVLKIRKLPNVWVRKDRDVQRMREGQELEVVVRPEVSGPITSILTVNPFQPGGGNQLPLLSLQTPASRVDSDHLIASLVTDVHVPSSLQPEMAGMAPVTQVNGLQ